MPPLFQNHTFHFIGFSIADIILNIEYSENWILFQLIFSKSLLLVQMYFPKK